MDIPSDEQIIADRLIQAAEAGLWAAARVWNQRGGFRPYPADLMDSPDQPECLRGFTRMEMEQASEFLVRLGLIEKREQGTAASPGAPLKRSEQRLARRRGARRNDGTKE